LPYGWKIELNSVDISDKISGFSIDTSLTNFCREMTLDFADASYYAGLDFSQLPETPEIEIFTKTGSTFYSQGKFFIERPAIADTINSELMQSVWGRSITALLAEPFASKITKVWDTQTTFFAICDEVCDLAGFTWDSAYSDISDFVIYPYTYEAEGLYPIDIITELAMLAGAVVITDRLGHLCIKQIDYSPSGADVTITDADISVISESPEWPVFANRLRITPIGSLGSYSIDMFIPNKCLQADAESRQKLYVRITDPEGEPVNGLVVTWDHDAIAATLDYEKTNTQEILIQNEQQKADDFYNVKVDVPPSSVVGIWAFADTARENNFAAGGYTIDGNTITLTDSLDYCDQTLIISYYAAGMSVNYITAGFVAEDVTVTADLDGQQDSEIVYIGNTCQCAPTIKLTAAPTSVVIGGASRLLVYAEDSGPIVSGRVVFMSQVSVRRGTLRWTTARLGAVRVRGEETVAINEINGLSQCEISMYPESIDFIYKIDDDGQVYGSDLYDSHDGKIINLNAIVASGVKLLVYYYAQGAAVNNFTGTKAGSCLIKASIETSREDGVSDTVSISVTDNSEPIDDYPDDFDEGDDGGYGGSAGTEEEDEPEEYDPNEDDGEQADFNWCVPDKGTTGARFTTALEHDCSCELLCNEEFDIYGTTQGYDGGSGKKISQLAIEQCDCEEGSAAYWEKYAELKAEALANCIGQCECAEGLEWDTENNQETIIGGESVSIYVTGGRAPFDWAVSGIGYSILVGETASRVNQISCAGGLCGTDYGAIATITVTDDCGSTVTGILRNAAGEWQLIDSCGDMGTPAGLVETIVGQYKYIEDHCTNVNQEECQNPECATCPSGIQSGGFEYDWGCADGWEVYQWVCSLEE
jgi:hypothetical protein